MSNDPKVGLKPFLEKDPTELRVAAVIRDFSKPFFELLRVLVVLGAIKFISERSGDFWLWLLYQVSSGVAMLYIISYCIVWRLRLFSQLTSSKWGQAIDVLLTIIIGRGGSANLNRRDKWIFRATAA